MAASASVNTGQIVQWLLEYGQRVRDIQERAWVYSHQSYVEKGLPLLFTATREHPQVLFGTSGGDAKAQKEFVRSLADKAPAYVAEVQPLITSLKVISQNFASIGQLLSELHRILGSLTLRSYPDLLHQYMDTFCGAVKAGILLEDVPRRAAAQMVHLACCHVDKDTATPLLAAVQDPIFTAPSMMLYLQKLFRASMPRIAQVLELVVGPAMTVADNCEGVAAAGLLEMSVVPQPVHVDYSQVDSARSSNAGGEVDASPAMGMFGMTRQQVYPFLRHREAIRQWGLLGFLVFPEVLSHPGSAKRLSLLLADGFALHIYKERVACSHQLALQHLGPVAAMALGTNSGASTGALSPRSGGLGGLLGKGMAMIGGVGRLRKSQTEELEDHDQSQTHRLFLDAACAAAVAAPLQHRMWRAFLIGQLRNIHAACLACPSRIPNQMEMVMAALSLGREELLWFCRHLGRKVPTELVPIMSARGILANGQLYTPTTDDALQALQLLSAMDAMHRLLVENHSALCRQIKEVIGADLQAHVVPCTPRVEIRLRQATAQATGGVAAAATAAAAGAQGLQPFRDLTDLLRSVLSSSSSPSDAPARVSSACGIWMYVSLQLASIDPPLKAAKVLQYAEDTRYLDVLQKALDAARLLHEGPLLHASAADLAPGMQFLVEPLLDAARLALGSGRTDHMQAALGAMQGLHWLLPSRAEAYAAAANSSNGGISTNALLTSSGRAAGSRTGDTAGSMTPGRQNSIKGRMPSQSADDLPRRCMELVIGCLEHLLVPVVRAPRASITITTTPRTPSHSHFRTSGSSIIKAIGVKARDVAPSATVGGRGLTPERVRVDASMSASNESGWAGFPQLHNAGDKEGPEEFDGFPRDPAMDAVALPPAAELAARLAPLVFALDNGRMLIASVGHDGHDGLMVCRTQLLEAVRINFAQLLDNTAGAISKSALPIPSVQLAPVRRFIEVVSILQPHLTTELLPEIARLLVQQAGAPTLQTIGLEAAYGPSKLRGAPPPPSTSAEVAPSVTPNPDMAGLSVTGRVGSISGTSAAGGVPRCPPNPPQASRNSHSSDADRGVGPLTAGLTASFGGVPSNSSPIASSVVRAIHSWLWSNVILDERRQGVSYDAEIGTFVAGTADNTAFSNSLATATSVRELALIFELFGPCAASDLTRGFDQLIHACLEQLQAFLDANQATLQDLLDAAHLPLEKRLAAVQRVLPSLMSPTNGSRGPQCLAGLVDGLQRLGRCLALRVQLGRAAAVSAERVADFVTLALREMATSSTVSSGGSLISTAAAPPAPERREWAAMLRLSAGGTGEADSSYSGCLLPERDDALLTAHLASMMSGLAAAQRWHRLPALLAALMAAPQWTGGSAPNPTPSRGKVSTPRGTSHVGQPASLSATIASMGIITTAAVSLFLSLQSAMSQVLHPAASQFLLGCCSPVPAMLCAYQRTALAVSQTAASGVFGECSAAATAAKQQMLSNLDHVSMLRKYTYQLPESAEHAESGDGDNVHGDVIGSNTPVSSLDLGQSWWAGSTVGASVSSIPPSKASGAIVQIEACEPSLAEGRWSGEIDSWRPPSRLLPLVMGQVG